MLIKHSIPMQRKNIVRDGLKVWLEGKDFTNSPPTSSWRDRSLCNQYTYNNLVTNSDFSNGSVGWLSYLSTILSTTSSEITCISNAIGSSVYNSLIGGTVIGNKYYIRAELNATSNQVLIKFGTSIAYHSGSGNYEKLSIIHTGTSTGHVIAIGDNRSNSWNNIKMKNPLVINLTQIFGANNEPSKEWCDANINFTATSGNVFKGNDATPSGMAYTTSSGSDNNGGVILDGIDDKLDIINYYPFSTDTEHTLEVTFKLDLYTTGSILVSFGGAGARYFVGFGSGGAGLWYIGNIVLTAPAVSLNVKTRYSFVRKGTNYKVYVNGIKIIDSDASLGGAISNTGTPFRVGAQWGSNSGYMQGKIYNVALYNRALTDTEILQNYNLLK